MLRNQKGFSFIGFLITLVLLGILLQLSLAPFKQTSAKGKKHIQTQSQAKQTVDNVRATLKKAENAAAKRAEGYGF